MAAGVGVVAAGLAGCTDRDAPAGFEPRSPEPTDPPPVPDGPERPPDRPADVTPETASEYAAAFEYAVAYNTLYCEDVSDIDVDSAAGLADETDHGVYVFAAASGYAQCGESEEPPFEDYGPRPVEWAIGADYAVRAGDVAIVEREPERAYGFGDDGESPSGFSITNFDHRAHQVDLSVSHRGESAYGDGHEVAPQSVLRVQNVSAARGTHDVTLETEEGASATGSWDPEPNGSMDWLARVLATGEATVEQRDPFSEL